MELNLVDLMAARPSRRQDAPRTERHRFRTGVKALWRRVNGLPEEAEPLVDGLNLTEAPAERRLRIVQVAGGCQRLRRLLEIGLYPGAQIEVVSEGKHGPVIVQVGQTRLAIGRNLARSVLVEFATPD